MNQQVAIVIVIACVLLSSGLTYIFTNNIKNDELLKLEADNSIEIHNKDKQIEDLIELVNQLQFNMEDEKSKFVGSWSPPFLSGTYDNGLFFYSNGTYISGVYMNKTAISNGTWDITDGKLVMTSYNYGTTTIYDYGFFEHDNKIIFIPIGTNYSDWKQTIENGAYTRRLATPNIQFARDEFSTLEVVAVDQSDLEWSNINITTSTGNYSSIVWGHAAYTSVRFPYGNGDSYPDWGTIEVGNVIHFFKNGTVTLTWIPTNTLIGVWEFT